MRTLSLLLFLLFLVSCSAQRQTTESTRQSREKPKNIILLIGDGMGLSQVSSSEFFKEEPSHFEEFPVIGLIKTSASDMLITDSAAGATAFASGIKTYNGAIGMAPDYSEVETIVEQLSGRGYSSGVIATSSIVHATPASFYAHSRSRSLYEDIAADLVDSEIDFFAGGGLAFFQQRSDSIDMISRLKERGFTINTESLTPTRADKQGYLLASDGMPKMVDGRGDFLPQATQLALDQLSKNNWGFILIVEGSQIDWGGHANDAEYLIGELLDFDKTVGLALAFARKNKETLVIVTADHETGGFTLAPTSNDYNSIQPSFSTGGHSATWIPVFAYGPGAELFGGVYENTEIYHKMIKSLSE
ncbi:MAG: alkaline phosphatase [Flavobacteriaceae bacterium]|nr:alkaline phosphatase [Flavobacteriaceae bacterium]